jgi:class III poly(R)-hydroxyalkanoic acid synthase PhaE subunit
MTESRDRTENWVQTWIEEQREKLRAAQSAQGASPGETDAKFRNAPHDSADFARGMWQFVDRFAMPGATPALGPLREHEQAWRELALAAARYQEVQAELNAKLTAAQMAALTLLEERARERAQSGRPLREPRELYDLWVECGEETYAQMAHSEAYCDLQARFANAGIELRARQQVVVDRLAKQFGLPTRAELDSVHQQMRMLREQVQELSNLVGSVKAGATQAKKRQPAPRRSQRSR